MKDRIEYFISRSFRNGLTGFLLYYVFFFIQKEKYPRFVIISIIILGFALLWIVLGFILRKRLKQKLARSTEDSPELTADSFEISDEKEWYKWIQPVGWILLVSFSITARDQNNYLELITITGLGIYAIWLFKQLKKMNEYLNT